MGVNHTLQVNSDTMSIYDHADFAKKIPDREKFDLVVETFQNHDFNDDGHLSITELNSIFQDLQFPKTKSELKGLLKKYDLNGDKAIDFTEYVNMVADNMVYRWPPTYEDFKEEIKTEEEFDAIVEAFRLFDKDDDSSITVKEIRTILKSLGKKFDKNTLDLLVNFIDVNNDGLIQFNEFIKIVEIQNFDSKKPTDKDHQTKLMFTQFSGGNGIITRQDITNFWAKMNMVNTNYTDDSELTNKEIDDIMELATGKEKADSMDLENFINLM